MVFTFRGCLKKNVMREAARQEAAARTCELKQLNHALWSFVSLLFSTAMCQA